MKKMQIARKLSQLFFLGLFVYILWSTTYPLTGIFSAELFFKADPLVMLATSLAERMFISGIIFAFLMLGLTMVLGRFFCGWVCPLGTMIDLASSKTKQAIDTDEHRKKMRLPKYVILGAAALAALAGFQLAWVFDPLVIMARFVSLNLIPAVTAGLDIAFGFLIRTFGWYGGFYDFYRGLKSSALGVKPHFFFHSLLIFLFFISILAASLKVKRFWCRSVCPLGALYAAFSRFALLHRVVSHCSQCRKCSRTCRMGAINYDASYAKEECVLCMDCVYDCTTARTRFVFFGRKHRHHAQEDGKGITRRQFLMLGFLAFAQSPAPEEAADAPEEKELITQVFPGRVIRPPASLKEPQFLNRCIRCGNCMKVCITNGLQPTLLQSGPAGIWTPQLVPEIGYCEYQCTLCGNVCPTGAIPKLTVPEKKKTRLGLARIDRSLCLPWKKGKACIVCEEHCPVAVKAIKLRKAIVEGREIMRPYINEELCIGCGICQTKCPVRPKRAVKVYPVKETRTDERER